MNRFYICQHSEDGRMFLMTNVSRDCHGFTFDKREAATFMADEAQTILASLRAGRRRFESRMMAQGYCEFDCGGPVRYSLLEV